MNATPSIATSAGSASDVTTPGAAGIARLGDAQDVRRFGGKAASLSKALAAELPVPPGFAIDAASARRIADGDAALCATLSRRAGALGGPFAVRSSAIDEDSAGASFAGQHRTILGVPAGAALEAAVRNVVASGDTSSARDYRGRLGLASGTGVAVVVQRMIDAEFSGVLFTRHPVTGADELVVEFVTGLGETLVSGHATPAMVRMSRDGRFTERRAGDQATELRLRKDGSTHAVERSDTRLPADALPEDALLALRHVALRAEGVAGPGRDLEWAWAGEHLWLLQSRPITTFGGTGASPGTDAAFAEQVQRDNVLHGDAGTKTLWSRVNVGEAIPGTVFPLTCQFHADSVEISPQRMFERMGVRPRGPIERPKAGAEAPSRFLCGRLWVNVDYMRSVADSLPGTSGDALEEAMLGRVRPGVPSHPRRDRLPVIVVRMIANIVGLPGQLRRLHDETHRWWRTSTTDVRSADLARAVAAFDDACTEYARIIDSQGLIATLAAGFWEPVAKIVRRIGTEDDLLQLTGGYGDVLEARMLERLWDVSRGTERIETFLSDYGYMAASGGELANPSWRESHGAIVRIVAQTAQRPDDEHPARRQALSHERFEATRKRLLATAPFLTGLALRIALGLANRMLPIREVGKACMAMGQDAGRAAMRRIGELLALRGDIDAATDVCFLTREDLRAAVAARADRRPRVREMKKLHAFYDALQPPEFCTGSQLRELIADALEESPTRALTVPRPSGGVHGIGVSRGRHTGTARVVLDPNHAMNLQPGDILVCRITDPGWTALFSIAGALVVDVGGMLSHGAIIARELGIPAIVNTRDGTRRIADGARITVDGATGEITIDQPAPARTP